MKKHLKILVSFLIIIASLLPLVSSVGAVDNQERVSAGIVQTSQDLPTLNISTFESIYDTIYKDKDAKISGEAKITGAENTAHNLKKSNIELKTRGNTTWGVDKRSFQIKFDSKVDLFEMGKAKKWILLANYFDGTFVRNKVIFDLGKEIGIPYVVESVFVNLYINGDYHGVYQLCEKVELGSSRIDIDSDYGVLLEMDGANQPDRFDDEIYFCSSTTGKPFVYKEYNTDFEDPAEAEMTAAVMAYTENFINTLEAELYSEDADWETIESMIDVDSFIRYYFITELSMEVDATYSSTFFYLDGPGDKLHCGPLWDYDRTMGWGTNYDQSANSDYFKNITDTTDKNRVEWFKMLFRHPEFVQRVNEMYEETIRDAFNTDKVIKMFQDYQALLMPSLIRNYDKYGVVFHNNSFTVEQIFQGTSREKLDYTTNELYKWLRARNQYLETAYGKYHPVLMYSTYDGTNGMDVAYSGGSITYHSSNMTGLSMELIGSKLDGTIEYAVAGRGKTSEYVSGGELAKLSSGKKFTGFSARLTGNLADHFSVQYRAYRSNSGWTSWKSDGACAGSETEYNYVERVQVRLVQKKDVKEATVSFVSAYGEAPADICAIVGNKVELPALEAEGYTFGGWYDNEEFIGEPINEMTVSGDTALYAKMISNMRGDIDGDEDVTLKDVFQMKLFLKKLVTPTEAELEAADVDHNGSITPADLLYLKVRIITKEWTI